MIPEHKADMNRCFAQIDGLIESVNTRFGDHATDVVKQMRVKSKALEAEFAVLLNRLGDEERDRDQTTKQRFKQPKLFKQE